MADHKDIAEHTLASMSGGNRARAASLAPGLHIAATPIGNAGDVTLRLLEALAGADLVLCEDTRQTAKLLAIHGITARLESYHEHNAARVRPRVLRALAADAAVVLVSDAGTPLISDPGYRLVTDVIAAGYPVTALPGPSSVLAALCVAGLPTDRFFMQGFLPVKPGARGKTIAELAAVPATLVILETAKRLAATLAALAHGLGPRRAAVARELTKRFEEVRRDELDALAAHYAANGAPRGEVVIVVAPPTAATATDDATLDAALRTALHTQSVSRAASSVAKQLDVPRKRAYARALTLAHDAAPEAEPNTERDA